LLAQPAQATICVKRLAIFLPSLIALGPFEANSDFFRQTSGCLAFQQPVKVTGL
jgi:hypothetical protein